MGNNRRLYGMDLCRRENSRWLGDDRQSGPVPEPFGIITQAGVQITTQSDEPLITQAGA